MDKKKILTFIILFLLVLPFILPLLHPGFFVSDDGNWMVIRLAGFHQALRLGQFPVRFLPTLNHGYGYPVLDFLYPLPFYLGEIIHLLRFSFSDSVKILFILSFLFSAWAMAFFAGAEWGNGPGILAGIFYALAPYRLFDVYKRGSLGEAVAFIFPPLIFFFLERYFKLQKWRDLSVGALLLAALICAHNVIAFIFFPVIVGYLLYKISQSQFRVRLLSRFSFFIILSLAASAWFWFPALYDLQFTRAVKIQVADFRSYFLSLDNFTSVLGPIALLIIAGAIYKIPFRKDWKLIGLLVITLVSLFLATPFSQIFWQVSPLPALVQFPWRFLAVTFFGSALLLGYLTAGLKPLYLAVIAVFILTLSAISFPPLTYVSYPDSYYTTNDATTTVKNEYMPRWVTTDFAVRPSGLFSRSDSQVTVNQVYFPGQTVVVNDQTVNIQPSANGLINFSVPDGTDISRLQVVFRETSWRLLADLISSLALILIFTLIIIK